MNILSLAKKLVGLRGQLLALPVLLAVLACPQLAVAKDWKQVRIATEGAYPPFNWVDAGGQLKGFDVDIANALCAEMKADCTLVAQDWEGLIPSLLANKYDAIVASMTITAERKQVVDFTEHYYTTPLSLVVPKDSLIADLSPASLNGKSLGAQASTTQASYADEKLRPAGAALKLYPTQDEVNLDMASGRLDAEVADKFVLVDWLKKDGAACCKLLGDFAGTNAQAGITVRKGDTDLKEMLNTALQAIRADGTYDRIASRYFDFEIY